MIKTQDLKAQIDELTKQNDTMLVELEQMKRLIAGGQTNAPDGGGSFGPSDGQQQGNQQQSGQQMSGHQAGGQGQGQQGGGQQQARGGQNSGGQEAQLANDLLQIKDMVAKLEAKTGQYVSNQTNGSLTDKDVVNLVLTLINGMVEWSSEYVSSRANGSGQQQ